MTRFLAPAVFSLAMLACATAPASGQPLRAAAGGFELEILVDGLPAPAFQHAGESYLLGRAGERYVLRVHNRTGRRAEVVTSVDGRDVIDGRPGDYRGRRGYLVPAYGYVDIDGWRLSERRAAAFRFAAVADSYAARMGNARNVGVIGVAVFPERVYTPLVRPPLAPRAERADDEAAPSRAAAQNRVAPASPPIAGAGAPAEPAAPRRARPGLGTEFGEAVSSPVREVPFTRANPAQPAVLLGVRYDDRAGLVALGIDVDRLPSYADEALMRRTADPSPAARRGFARPPAGWSERQ